MGEQATDAGQTNIAICTPVQMNQTTCNAVVETTGGGSTSGPTAHSTDDPPRNSQTPISSSTTTTYELYRNFL